MSSGRPLVVTYFLCFSSGDSFISFQRCAVFLFTLTFQILPPPNVTGKLHLGHAWDNTLQDLIIRRKRILKVGDLFAFYLIWYGFGRGAIIEPLRVGGHPTDALRMFGLPTNIVLSLGLFMVGGIAIILLKKKFIKDQPYYVDMFVEEKTGEIIDEDHTV